MIKLKDIKKTYYIGDIIVPALNGVSLEIKQGEFVSIMGASGSGKSTLLHILGLLDKPSSGSYKLATREVSGLSDPQLAVVRNSILGFVFQSFNLLPRMSALENVLMPLVYSQNAKDPVKAEKRARELLVKVGLGERMTHKSNELSGGQQQRVAIARALINSPMCIFADEPTGNLDSKSAIEIITLLKELNDSGITIIMVTHEPDLAEAAKRIIRLQDGKIVSDETSRGAVKPAGKEDEYVFPLNKQVLKLSRFKDHLVQAARSLISNKTRSFLSILGVLIGVTGLIAMLALGTGAREETKKQMASLGSNILMVFPGSSHRGGIVMESGQSVRFTLEDAEAIKKDIEHVSGVAPYANGRGQVVYNALNSNTRIESTMPDYQYMKNAVPVSGRFFTEQENARRAKVCLLGQTVKKALFPDKNPLGEFVKINKVDFQVIGVLPAKGSGGWRDEDDKVVMPINTAMYRLLGKQYIDNIEVQINDEQHMDTAGYKIVTLLLKLHRLPESKRDSITVRNMAEIQATISATMNVFSTLLGSVAFVSLLVGGIGIMNIMLVSVTERTREIGLRKAIGADNHDILFQFMIEAVVICLFGGVIGIMLGSAIAVGLSVFAGWKTMVSLFSIGLAFTFSVVIGLVFGTWPAKKASELNPIEALRYE